MIELSRGMVVAIQRCAREYYYRYERRLRSLEEKSYLRFGTDFHDILHMYWNSGYDSAIEYINVMSSGGEMPEDIARRLFALLEGYRLRWDREDWDVVSGERRFVTSKPYVDGVKLNARPDLVVRTTAPVTTIDGELIRKGTWIVDHKTSTPGSAMTYVPALDIQMLHYLLAYRIEHSFSGEGEAITGVCYDVMAKSAQRQKAGESDDDYAVRLVKWHTDRERLEERYVRSYVCYTDDRVGQYIEQVLAAARRIDTARELDVWEQSFGCCRREFGLCEFYDMCRSNGRSDQYEEQQNVIS